jgi:hypothetical protein
MEYGVQTMRNSFTSVGILFLILLFCQQFVIAQNWRDRLIPLQTSIDEMERLLTARPFNARVLKDPKIEDSYIFSFKEGTLLVYFSLGRCIDGVFGRYELDKGVIIEAYFVPQKWRKISFYEKDVKSLLKDTTAAPQLISYQNVKYGIRYTLQQGKVSEIAFIGPDSMNPIKCVEK